MFKPGTLVRFTSAALEMLFAGRYSVPYAKKLNGHWVYARGTGFTPKDGQAGIVVASEQVYNVASGQMYNLVVLFGDKLVLPFEDELEEIKEKHGYQQMSKSSLSRILEGIQEQKKQEEIVSFKKYVSRLKPGDLIFVKGLDIISEIRFTERDTSDDGCELNLNASINKKHIQDTDAMWLPAVDHDKAYSALVIAKAGEYENCSCFFLFKPYIKQNDLFVLIDTKFYYVRIRPDNDQLTPEDYEMGEEIKYIL